jgi:hypothetical protein
MLLNGLLILTRLYHRWADFSVRKWLPGGQSGSRMGGVAGGTTVKFLINQKRAGLERFTNMRYLKGFSAVC